MTVSTLFSQAQTTVNTGLGGQLTVTTEFTMSADAALSGIWYYSPSGSTGLPAQCGIFRTSDQALIASNVAPSWSGAAGSGWIRCVFPGTDTLHNTVTYLVAVYLGNANVGGKQTLFWTTGPGASGFTSGPLTAPNYTSSGNVQGMVQSGNLGLAYPTITESGSWYGPDVEVTTSTSFSGSASLNVAFAASSTGSKTVSGSAALSVALGESATGRKAAHGSTTQGVAFAVSVSGHKAVTALASLAITFGLAALNTSQTGITMVLCQVVDSGSMAVTLIDPDLISVRWSVTPVPSWAACRQVVEDPLFAGRFLLVGWLPSLPRPNFPAAN